MRRSSGQSGFTLIELLAVLVILGILIAVLVPRLARAIDAAKERTTRVDLVNIDTALGEYENQMGDYPPSHFVEAWGAPPNTTNLGAETLVLSLWSPKFKTTRPPDRLVNTDGDSSRKPLAIFPKADLFELSDQWGNPIAYFHHRDYGRKDVYLTHSPDTGEEYESTVEARKDPVTGLYYNPDRYQLISAGLDGKFGPNEDGTLDDIGNWQKPR